MLHVQRLQLVICILTCIHLPHLMLLTCFLERYFPIVKCFNSFPTFSFMYIRTSSEYYLYKDFSWLNAYWHAYIYHILCYLLALLKGTFLLLNASILSNIIFYVYQNFFRISPGFCFADGLASLALRHQGMKLGSGDGIFDWNITGASICYLAGEVWILSYT